MRTFSTNSQSAIFGGCVFHQDIAIIVKKRYHENFGLKTPKTIRLLHLPGPSGKLTVSDETEKAHKTFATAKVLQRHPNRRGSLKLTKEAFKSLEKIALDTSDVFGNIRLFGAPTTLT